MILLFLFLLGMCVGSFLNVVIDRLPEGRSVVRGRSICDFCKRILVWYDLFPVLSFFLLKGQCRYCRKKLSFQYPLIEGLTGILFAALYILFYSNSSSGGYFLLHLFLSFMLTGSFLAIFVIDLKYGIIPDELVIAVCIISFMLTGITSGTTEIFIHTGVGILYALLFFILFLITGGKGMGFGDVKLAFAIGLLLGFPGVLISFYLSFLTGAVVSLILVVQGKKRLKSKIAFGPFLIAGTSIAYMWGDQLWLFFRKIVGV